MTFSDRFETATVDVDYADRRDVARFDFAAVKVNAIRRDSRSVPVKDADIVVTCLLYTSDAAAQ